MAAAEDGNVVPLPVRTVPAEAAPGLPPSSAAERTAEQVTIGDLVEMAAGSAVAVGAAGARAVARTTAAAGSVVNRILDLPAGRLTSKAFTTFFQAPARQAQVDLYTAGRRAEEAIGQVVAIVVPVVVDAVNVSVVVDRLDINKLLNRIDVNALMERIDLDRLLREVDLDALMRRVDVQALIDRVDVDGLMERVDVDALLERIDVEALMVRANVGELVARSTQTIAGSTIDLARRQGAGLDTIIGGIVNRTLGRKRDDLPTGPPLLVEGEGVDETEIPE